ncbi:unnamed protein product [Rhizophagus irregularis]|uniref:Zn(2)-C6 fungal-type domain-containing protein n=1 Tax=Rhizophagus irregularis TaxID=588596 RepID=A0A916EDH3_9GLOM|nr:unnamed protein product [Rhizophagus irregularis]
MGNHDTHMVNIGVLPNFILMNRSKVTVACKACQKKKVKCTGISPCTNCIRAGQRCEFTGTAKKRGPRNGNVEVIKSPARRIENVLQENPNLRSQIEQMLAHGNTRPAVRSVPIIPANAPIVIIDDDTGITTDASQSHGIPISRSRERYTHGTYSRDINVPVETQQLPILRKPIPIYPVTMHRNHVTTMQVSEMDSPNMLNNKTTLPPITELNQQFGHIFNTHNSHNSSQNRMALPTPNRTSRKKNSMSIVNVSSGIEVLLPPAPDLENPLDSNAMLIDNQHPIKLPPLNLPAVQEKISTFASLPSPSQKTNDFYMLKKYQDYYNNPPTPTDSTASTPSSPRNAPNSDRATNPLLSHPVTWGY